VNRSATLGWLFVTVWATWLCALGGHLAQFSWLGRWSPDLHSALFVALSARIAASDISRLALCMGIARVAVSIDTPAAVLAGALAAGALLRTARGAVTLDNPMVTAALAFAVSLGNGAWLELVHLQTRAQATQSWSASGPCWRGAISTAVATMLLAGVLVHLPGLSSLLRRKTWAVGASLR
jgi:hypothetical protein